VHHLDARTVVTLAVAIVASAPVVPAFVRWWTAREADGAPRAAAWALAGALGRPALLALLLVASAAVLSAGTHNPFIYFRF
jgi:hypothetical protein